MAITSLQTIAQVRNWTSSRRGTKTIAFVPTMGALHDGHLNLVRQGARIADEVMVSIFVNPKQFGPREDFSAYPRPLESDLSKLSSINCSAVFLPSTEEMYQPFYQSSIRLNSELGSILCGASRPGHFDGVMTVVCKLLNIVQPDYAIFGKKDYQQLAVIRAMVADLNINVAVVAGDIVREESGLAMSSRNNYLTQDQRAEAAALFRGLSACSRLHKAGERSAVQLIRHFVSSLERSPAFEMEYCEIRSESDLTRTVEYLDEPARMLVAARINGVRLIDNVELVSGAKSARNYPDERSEEGSRRN